MRNKRFKRYKKSRHKRNIKIFVFGFVFPVITLLITYVFISIFIIPIFANK